MTITEERIRERCTDAVFERGRNYRTEGRVRRIDRFGDVVTATVRGSQWYDVTVEPSPPNFEADCTCPYGGPGECKHVVAVSLEVAADPPADESDRIESALDDVPATKLRSFLTDEFARNPGLRDRFLAQFGDPPGKPADEYRAEIERLFDRHADDEPVVLEAIDFSRVTELAERYRDRDCYREATTIYRALVEFLEQNMNRVDAAYDHYVETFQRALDGYVTCVQAADLDQQEYESHVEVLSTRTVEAVDYLAERYVAALEKLRSDQ